MTFISDVTFLSWNGTSVIPNFRQNQSDKNNGKFTYCLEIKSKMAVIVSIYTLNPLKQFPVVVVNLSTPMSV